jgi:penicillin-binding protein 1A
MRDRREAGRARREPVFSDERTSFSELRVAPSDRVGGEMRLRSGGRDRGEGSRRGRSRRRGRSILGRVLYISVVLAIWCAIGLVGLLGFHATQLPPIDQLAVPKRPPNVAILAADGTLLANRGETGGRSVALKELPPHLPRAFVAIEDRRFYSHYGVDPIGIARAAFRNITSRGVAQGGSTLTQQLAKNLFLTQERTASRKIQEAILSLWLEHRYSKDQIIELYVNRVYFGAGAYGGRGGGAALLRKPAPRGHDRGGCDAGGPRPGALAPRAEPEPRGREGARRNRSRSRWRTRATYRPSN